MQRFALILTVCAIFSLGLVMIFNTTSAEVLDLSLNRSTHQALWKQMTYSLIGVCFAYAIYYFGYQNLIRYSPVLLFFLTFLLVLCLIPGIGKTVNGSRRWIGYGSFSIQPSEFVKYILPAFFIFRIQKFQTLSFLEFLKLVTILLVPLFLIFIEPNNGTAGVIGVTLAILFLLVNIPFRYWAIPLTIFFVLGASIAFHLPYVKARLEVYMNPELDLKGKGHQPFQAKIAAGSGGLLGKGVGNSFQKLSYLPEAQNDYIAAIYAEETGFLGTVFLIIAYMILAYLGFAIAYRSTSVEACCYGAVITFLISFQAFMNLGVVSGLLPSTGLNLPFFSQGGSSLMANLMGVGTLLSINKHEETFE